MTITFRALGIPTFLRCKTAATCVVLFGWQLLASAQTTPPSNTAPVSSSQAAAATAAPVEPLSNIAIAPGDLLDVEVFNTPELSAHLRVDQRGEITLPLGGNVAVKGMFAKDAARAIVNRLKSAQIMLAPIVNVSIIEYASAGVTVLGEVRSPGIYTLLGPRSLYDALAAAGGATSSEGLTITIAHANDADHPVNIDVTTVGYSPIQKATVVRPGDTIVVNRAPLVYIVGDVNHSGAFYIQGGETLTVLNLVALADGAERDAAMSAVKILRQTPTGIQTIPLNLTKVMRNQEPNPVLHAGDVLVVPRSGFKNFALTALPGLSNALSGAASTALITH